MISDLEVYIRSKAVAVGVFVAKIKSPALVWEEEKRKEKGGGGQSPTFLSTVFKDQTLIPTGPLCQISISIYM